jgi:ATP-dependent Clp protease protease subunit
MISSLIIDPRIKIRDPAQLVSMPKVIRVSSFDEETARTFVKEFSLAHQTGQPIIPIVIDSYGGDAYALWTMVDTIKKSDVPVATIIEGKAMSCGAALFTCGTQGYRYIGPHSTLMIHEVSSEDVPGKAEDMKVGMQETDRLNKMMYALMEENIGKPKGYLWKLTQKRTRTDWYMAPKEAVKHGIANKVGIPTFKTEVIVNITLE